MRKLLFLQKFIKIMYFKIIFLSSFFLGVQLTDDGAKQNNSTFDIKQRIALFQSATQNDKAKQMAEIEKTVSNQIDEAFELVKVLLRNDSPSTNHNTVGHGSGSSSSQPVNVHMETNRSAAVGIKHHLVPRSSTTTATATLSGTRQTLLELRNRLDNIGKMKMANSAETAPRRTTPFHQKQLRKAQSPKPIVVDKRQIVKEKALSKWKWLMEAIVLNIDKLYFYADHTRKFVGDERLMLDHCLALVKEANDRPLKSFKQIAGLFAKAKKYFNAYKRLRHQSEKDYLKEQHHVNMLQDSDQSDSGSENAYAFAKQGLGHQRHSHRSSRIIDHGSVTECSDNDELNCIDFDAETIPNDSGSDNERSDQGSVMTQQSVNQTDQNDTDTAGSTTDHSKTNDKPLNKAYSDGELAAERRSELKMDFVEKHRRRAKSDNPETDTEIESDDEEELISDEGEDAFEDEEEEGNATTDSDEI